MSDKNDKMQEQKSFFQVNSTKKEGDTQPLNNVPSFFSKTNINNDSSKITEAPNLGFGNSNSLINTNSSFFNQANDKINNFTNANSNTQTGELNAVKTNPLNDPNSNNKTEGGFFNNFPKTPNNTLDTKPNIIFGGDNNTGGFFGSVKTNAQSLNIPPVSDSDKSKQAPFQFGNIKPMNESFSSNSFNFNKNNDQLTSNSQGNTSDNTKPQGFMSGINKLSNEDAISNPFGKNTMETKIDNSIKGSTSKDLFGNPISSNSLLSTTTGQPSTPFQSNNSFLLKSTETNNISKEIQSNGEKKLDFFSQNKSMTVPGQDKESKIEIPKVVTEVKEAQKSTFENNTFGNSVENSTKTGFTFGMKTDQNKNTETSKTEPSTFSFNPKSNTESSNMFLKTPTSTLPTGFQSTPLSVPTNQSPSVNINKNEDLDKNKEKSYLTS